MDHGQVFVLAIIAISMLGGMGRMWVRARHGYPLEDSRRARMRRRYGADFGETTDPDAARKIELLSNENEKLTGQIGRLEERLRVLERIATDPAERTAREIDALRDAD
jgi:hypothetical protein